MSAFRLSIVAMSLMACLSNKADDTTDIDVGGDSGSNTDTDDSDTQQDTNPPTQAGFEPDYVIFGSATYVQNSTDIACYADENGENCGVYIIGLINNAEWGGWQDGDNGCLIYFDTKPEFVVENGVETGYIDSGHYYGWEWDAAQAYIGATNACGEIDSSDPALGLFNTLTGTNPTIGLGAASTDMLDALSGANIEGDWETDWLPYLVNVSNWLSGFSSLMESDAMAPLTLSLGMAYDVAEDGTLSEDKVEVSDTYLVDAVYNSIPIYVYQIGAFIE